MATQQYLKAIYYNTMEEIEHSSWNKGVGCHGNQLTSDPLLPNIVGMKYIRQQPNVQTLWIYCG